MSNELDMATNGSGGPMPRSLVKHHVRRRFERVAAAYDAVAVVQRQVTDELVERLHVVKLEPRRILDAGCGTGYALKGLSRRFPESELLLVDFAPAMLQQARHRSTARVRLICCDVECMPIAAQSVDMIFSSASLQWCDLDQVLTEFLRVLKPEGLLTFATFGPDTLRELRAAWRQVDAEDHLLDYVDMHNIGDALVRYQFTQPVMDVDYLAITHRDFEGALSDLKSLGINAAVDRNRGLTGKRKYHRLRRACERFRNAQGLLESTCEIVYGHAWAPAQIQLADVEGGVAVPLSRLRRR